MSAMQLVDGHHLWDLDAVDYPWLRALGVRRFFGDPTSIQRNYGVPDLRGDAASIEILPSVHVQVGCAPGMELAETRWLSTVGNREQLPTAIVAALDFTHPDVEEMLAAQALSPRLRGVRHIVGRESADDARTGCGQVLDDPTFLRGLRMLAVHGLSFNLQLTEPQMKDAADLFERVPGLAIALCHCGSPWKQSQSGIEAWRAGLARLARLPRLVCKLSGLSMFDPRWTTARFVSPCAPCSTFSDPSAVFSEAISLWTGPAPQLRGNRQRNGSGARRVRRERERLRLQGNRPSILPVLIPGDGLLSGWNPAALLLTVTCIRSTSRRRRFPDLEPAQPSSRRGTAVGNRIAGY